jgi:cytochrome c5
MRLRATCTCMILFIVIWLLKVSTAQPASQQTFFVRGYVAASVTTETQRRKDIALPHASVFLVRFNDLNTPLTSALSDLSGRFALKTNETGVFTLCVEADGFPRSCSGQEFRIDPTSPQSGNNVLRYGTLRLRPDLKPDSAVVYGVVTLKDGTIARGFEPFLGVNAYSRVELSTSAGTRYKGFINNFGEYIVPKVPIQEDFVLRASIDSETLEQRINKLTDLQGTRAYPFDFVFRNSAPRIRLISAQINQKPIQIAAPGSMVTLKAVAEDSDGDTLEYRWLLPEDEGIVGPSNNPELKWTLPSRRGRFVVTVLVSDGRGGYARDSFTITATSAGVPFNGTVVETSGAAVPGALVAVNGRLTNTNAQGRFSLQVPVRDTYVMTIRKPGVEVPNQPAYGTVSFVYTGSITGGRWVLRRAAVFSVDPTQPITLEHKRDERHCVGPYASKIDWTPYLTPGVFEWQDGRGNVRSLGEAGQEDPKAIQTIVRLLSRINFGLARKFSEITKVQAGIDDRRVPCRNGIKVEIPPNALEDPTTRQAPTGNVQVALSTVDLTASDQMPGDYSAVDPNGKFLSMETFDAGGVEIGAGPSRFNLKPGTTATVTIPVDATQLVANPTLEPLVPFLYFDEQAGVWRPEGTTTLTGSGANAAYVMKVKHFSTMNADILKSGQSCVAVEVDPLANFTLPFNVEVTMPPSVVNPAVIQVRTLTVDSLKSNVIYNLPNNTNIMLTPIISGVKADGSPGDVPAGVFVVNTGGPQSSAVNPPPKNADGTYYAEVNGQPTGPCGVRVTLKKLNGPTLATGFEFLQGLYFEASNITEFAQTSQTVADNIEQGAIDYYGQVDPRELRKSFNLFIQKNKFGQSLGATEVEYDAQYANSGDLGFGRDMHCRRNVATDGKFDIACYVTNYGQPPINDPDQVDADNALSKTNPDATVAMEYSRVENPPGDPNEFPDDDRAVKFCVYGKNPDAPPVTKADLDGFGERPVPQLCVICHGGQVASLPADPSNPAGPKKGAFADRNDILTMKSNFLPFDLHLYNFPASKSKPSQQPAFKNLNVDIVREVATASGATGAAIIELINAWYAGGSADQLEDAVITNWDAANPSSNAHRFYKDVFARACRTCHVAQPFTAPVYTSKVDFENDIAIVQARVCLQKVMPHAKRTNNVFWTSLNPNMPAFLQLYGQTLAGWLALDTAQCGLFFQPGTNVQSVFSNEIYPILANNCTTCHSVMGNANFTVGNIPATYNSLLTATAKDGTSKYIVPANPALSLLFKRITTGGVGVRMPQFGADLTTTDTDKPPDGKNDAPEIQDWITSGAGGP